MTADVWLREVALVTWWRHNKFVGLNSIFHLNLKHDNVGEEERKKDLEQAAMLILYAGPG